MAKTSALAKLAKAAASGGKDVTALIEAAGVIVTTANVLIKEAKPIVDSIDKEAVAAAAKTGMQIASAGAEKAGRAAGKAGRAAADSAGRAGKAAKDAAGSAADSVGNVFSRLGEAKDGIFEDLAKAKSEKELKNAIRDARQSVLENATTSLSIADYAKAKEKAGDMAIGPINDMPGCFVIATYRKMDFDRDYTDYTGIFVGQSANAAEGVEHAMSKNGNADVYADVKFKQNVRIFVYNCMPEDLDERYFALLQTFDDERSYN